MTHPIIVVKARVSKITLVTVISKRLIILIMVPAKIQIILKVATIKITLMTIRKVLTRSQTATITKAQIIKMAMATKAIQISNKAITRMMANKTLTTINKAATKKMTTQILTKIRKTTTSITIQVKIKMAMIIMMTIIKIILVKATTMITVTTTKTILENTKAMTMIKKAMMTRRTMINPEMVNMMALLMMIHKTRLVANILAMTLLVLEKIRIKVDKVVAKIIRAISLDMATTPAIKASQDKEINRVKVDKASQDKEINRGKAVKTSRDKEIMTKMIDQVTNQVKAIIKVDKPIQINLLILLIKVATQEDKIRNRANLLKAISLQGQVRKDHNNIPISHLDSKVGKVDMMANTHHLHNLVDRQGKRTNLDKERLTIHKVYHLRNNITMSQRA